MSLFIFCTDPVQSQQRDTVTEKSGRQITLSEVVVRSGMNVPGFIDRVRHDTSFYKAFKNLRILNYSARNDIRMMDKKGREKAAQQSRTRQWAADGCRVTQWIEENHSGDFYDAKGAYQYYTAEIFDALFFSFDTVCGENNLVGDMRHTLKGKSGLQKNKEQLKILFFNPGSEIPGIPLMGDKVQIFDDSHARLYDFDIDIEMKHGRSSYVFSITARKDLSAFERDRIVIDRMVTWFDYQNFEVLARQYDMSYDAGIYSFSVSMEVELTHVGDYLVPSVLRYNGTWGVAFKKKERGVFTTTIVH